MSREGLGIVINMGVVCEPFFTAIQFTAVRSWGETPSVQQWTNVDMHRHKKRAF